MIEYDGREINDFEDIVIAARRAVWRACQDGAFDGFEPKDGWGSEAGHGVEQLCECGVPGCIHCPVLPEAMGWLSGEDGRQLIWAALAVGRAATAAGLDSEQRQFLMASVLMEGAAIQMAESAN